MLDYLLEPDDPSPDELLGEYVEEHILEYVIPWLESLNFSESYIDDVYSMLSDLAGEDVDIDNFDIIYSFDEDDILDALDDELYGVLFDYACDDVIKHSRDDD